MSELEMPPSTPGSKGGLPLLACLTLCYLVSFAAIEGALRGLSDWYPAANKPGWAPPIWLFAPLWTVLYGLLGVALWQVWTQPGAGRTRAVALFVGQLLLSGAWAWIFFVYRSFLFAFIEAAAVWVVLGITAFVFVRIKVSAMCLLLPQWIWVAFAAGLSFAVYRLNK